MGRFSNSPTPAFALGNSSLHRLNIMGFGGRIIFLKESTDLKIISASGMGKEKKTEKLELSCFKKKSPLSLS